jgi:predicted 2-oxoglutarate/Fe(II)-dependent dioxygenase YbiX
VIEILLGQGVYEFQAKLSQHVTLSGSLNTELQILKKYRDKLISHKLLLQTVRQVSSRIKEHPKSQSINFSNLRLLLTSTPRFEEMGTSESYDLYHRIQLFLQENNIPKLRAAAKLFVDDPDAVINGRLILH